jgi:hypothetical protein
MHHTAFGDVNWGRRAAPAVGAAPAAAPAVKASHTPPLRSIYPSSLNRKPQTPNPKPLNPMPAHAPAPHRSALRQRRAPSVRRRVTRADVPAAAGGGEGGGDEAHGGGDGSGSGNSAIIIIIMIIIINIIIIIIIITCVVAVLTSPLCSSSSLHSTGITN